MQHNENGILTLIAGEALEPYRRVKFTAARTVMYADANEKAIGATVDRVANGDPVTVHLFSRPGTFEIEATGVVVINTSLYGTDDGKVDDTGSGVYFGVAMAASAGAGEIIEVMPLREEGDQAANVAAAAAATAAAPGNLTQAPLTGTLTGTLDNILADIGDTSTIDGSAAVNKNFKEIQDEMAAVRVDLIATHAEVVKLVADLAAVRTTLNAEIVALKAAGLQASA